MFTDLLHKQLIWRISAGAINKNAIVGLAVRKATYAILLKSNTIMLLKNRLILELVYQN